MARKAKLLEKLGEEIKDIKIENVNELDIRLLAKLII